jgi:hypothetical protein
VYFDKNRRFLLQPFKCSRICRLCLKHYDEDFFRCVDTEKVIMFWDFGRAPVFRYGSKYSHYLQNYWIFVFCSSSRVVKTRQPRNRNENKRILFVYSCRTFLLSIPLYDSADGLTCPRISFSHCITSAIHPRFDWFSSRFVLFQKDCKYKVVHILAYLYRLDTAVIPNGQSGRVSGRSMCYLRVNI